MPSFTPEEIINLTNAYRKAQNLPELKVNPSLMEAAKARANDMASTGNFAHSIATTTEMKTPWAFMQKYGYDFHDAGENLAEGYQNSQQILDAWKKSQSHNENLVDGKYTDIGVAVVPGKYNGKDTYFTIQFFGSPKPTSTKQIREIREPSKEIRPMTKTNERTMREIRKSEEKVNETPISSFRPGAIEPVPVRNSASTVSNSGNIDRSIRLSP